jgi:hypothetical protein
MKYPAILLALSLCAFGAPRTEVVKVIKPDTVKTITYDTLTITRTLKDTTVLVKVDTATTKKEVKKVIK